MFVGMEFIIIFGLVLFIKFTILHGRLMDSIKSAKSSKGDQGIKISAAEKKDIFDAFEKLETKILKIKKTIEDK